MRSDEVIYLQCMGKMILVSKPVHPARPNFVITWKGRDWSGFRTLTECEAQFPELEQKSGDHYAVVER
jgi:hypothetical protein